MIKFYESEIVWFAVIYYVFDVVLINAVDDLKTKIGLVALGVCMSGAFLLFWKLERSIEKMRRKAG